MTQLALYESAREALAEALRVDEVMTVRSTAERMKLYGRQAKDKRIIADATALMLRAERKLGQLLVSAKETGQLGIGRPEKSNVTRGNGDTQAPFPDGEDDQVERITLKDAGIDKRLSSRAQRWAKVGDPEFEAHLQSVRDRIESDGAVVVNPLKDLTTGEKKAKRAARESELGKKQAALPDAKFGVIYADPEWKFQTFSEAGLDRSADNHYPTSGLEAIKARDVGSLAADDCVLFLWATVPMLPQALEVMAAWGFAYKSNFDWRKDKAGTGFWNRNRHEHLLVGTRGNIPAPAPGDQFESSIEAAVGAHSAKPEKFYEIIEAYFPTLPKIELNARVARNGWARWGWEAPEDSNSENTQERSGTAREAPGSSAPGDGIAGLSEDQAQLRAGEVAAQSAALKVQQQGAQPAAPFRFTPADDAVLRQAYALPVERFDLSIVAATVGCSKEQAKKRASHLKISRPEHQRRAVAEANRRRAAVGASQTAGETP